MWQSIGACKLSGYCMHRIFFPYRAAPLRPCTRPATATRAPLPLLTTSICRAGRSHGMGHSLRCRNFERVGPPRGHVARHTRLEKHRARAATPTVPSHHLLRCPHDTRAVSCAAQLYISRPTPGRHRSSKDTEQARAKNRRPWPATAATKQEQQEPSRSRSRHRRRYRCGSSWPG